MGAARTYRAVESVEDYCRACKTDRLHTVIAAECTGCELCIPPCPVDCIVMQPAPGAEPVS